ncbi:MAG: hypothetical protein QOE09_1158 [Ilumatobacteraceae bacterium]
MDGSGSRLRPAWRVLRAFAVLPIAVGVLSTAQRVWAADTSPPTTPGTITVSAVTSSSATLTWGRSTDNVKVEGYRIYRGPAAAPDSALTLIATLDPVTTYSAAHLYSSTAYKFGVVALDASNNKSAMRTAQFTTATSSDTTAPAAPSSTSISGHAFSSSRIDVFWGTSTSTDVAGYQVWRDGTLVATVDLPNTPRYSDNGLAPASTHSYVFKSIDSAKNVSAGTAARSVTTLAAGAIAIERGPYLSNVTGTSGIVSWWTNLGTAGSVTVNGQTVVDSAGAVQHHEVSIAGLSPNTSYPYTVSSGSASATGTLRTAATAGTTFSFAAIGDFGGGSGGETVNANNVATSGTQFIQTVGDNIYPSSGLPDPNFTTTYSDFDQRFFKPFATAVKSQAFFPANGNKEYYADGEFWSSFPMPGTNHSWYSYDWGSAHILVLDSEQDYAMGSDQYNFAAADLAAHQDAVWRIVAIQRPPYSSTSASSSSTGVRQYLVPLFQQQHVQLVLSGNSHNYERTFPLINSAPSANGVTYIVTGAGGNGFNAFTGTPPAYSAFRESTYYEYLKVTVSPTALTADAIRADTNAVVDSATIAPSAGGGDTVAPSVPGGVTATASGSSSIDVAWSASTDAVGVAGYNVFRDGAATAVATVTGTTFTDTGLSAGSTHSYTVNAFDAAGNTSALSAPPASATTTAGGGSTVTVVASDDATVSSAAGKADTNYGQLTTLTVDADGSISDFLLNFAVPSTCTGTAAVLSLTVAGNSSNNSVNGGDFYAAPGTWNETTVTATNAPAHVGAAVHTGAVALNTTYQIDVTSLMGAGTTNGVFSIRATTPSTDAAVYVSKNATNGTTAGPKLQLTCS